jgi:transcriptional regulator with XRE-family HTH domain
MPRSSDHGHPPRARTDYGRSLALIVRGIRSQEPRRSQEQLARDLGVTLPAIKQIERGERKSRLNCHLLNKLVAEGVPAALLAETTEPDRQRVRDVLGYLRHLKVPAEKLGEWSSTLGLRPTNDAPVLYRVDVSPMSGEDDLFSRLGYYRMQSWIENESEALCIATERFAMTLLPPRLQASAIESSYGTGPLARTLARVYQERAASVVSGLKTGRVRSICAVFLEASTRSMFSSAEDREAVRTFLRELGANGRLELRLLADNALTDLERARFSSIVISAPRVAVASSDQAYNSVVCRERRVERETPYAHEQRDLVQTHSEAGRRLSVDELLELAS